MAKELDITIIATKIQRNKKSLIQALGVHLFAVIFLWYVIIKQLSIFFRSLYLQQK